MWSTYWRSDGSVEDAAAVLDVSRAPSVGGVTGLSLRRGDTLMCAVSPAGSASIEAYVELKNNDGVATWSTCGVRKANAASAST